MKRAVFLDRDGTIIRELDNMRLSDLPRMRFFPKVAEAIRSLNKLGFLVIVITNQPVVSRGWATEREVDQIHAVLVQRLAKKGAKIDAVYFCPHHPDANIPKYRKRCRCRKPNIGMIIKAAKKFNIDLKKSFIIGDRTADIAAGNRAGMRVILVKTGYAGRDGKHKGKPDFVAKNLREAVGIIQNNTPNTKEDEIHL